MAALLLLVSLALTAASAASLGSLACAHGVRKVKTRRDKRMSVEEAAKEPLIVFLSLLLLGCVAGVAFTPWVIPVALGLAALAAHDVPRRVAAQGRRVRRQECERHLDMMCDIVAMGVDAGLSFDAALGLYCSRFENALSDEMQLALRQWSHGLASRGEALENLAEDVGSPLLKRFADTVAHAVERGAPLAQMLRRYAVELRRRRKVCAERRVERAPIKMLVPTGVCILPAMLLLVMGPMLLQFVGT